MDLTLISAIQQDRQAYLQLPLSLQLKPDLALALVRHHPHSLDQIPSSLLTKELVMAGLSHQFHNLVDLPERFRAEPEIVQLALKYDSRQLQYATKEVKANREVVMTAVKSDGLALQYAEPHLQADLELVTRAVTNNGWALRYASDDLRGYWPLVKLAVRIDSCIIDHVRSAAYQTREAALWLLRRGCGGIYFNLPYALQQDREIVLWALKRRVPRRDYSKITLPLELRADREIILTALKTGYRLHIAADELKADYQLVRVAVEWDGLNFWWASPQLQTNSTLLRKAAKSNWTMAQYFPQTWLADKQLMTSLLTVQPLIFTFLTPELRGELDLIKLVLPHYEVWSLLPEEVKTNYQVLTWASRWSYLHQQLATSLAGQACLLYQQVKLEADWAVLPELMSYSGWMIADRLTAGRHSPWSLSDWGNQGKLSDLTLTWC